MARGRGGALAEYAEFKFSDGRWERPVFRRGSGPGVVVIHEMPGLHPLVVRFADRLAGAGLTVFLPSLFGEPGRPVTRGYAMMEAVKTICVRREFDVWATDKSSPIVDWLKALARTIRPECGGSGVGAVGMCFTGNFALAMMTEPSVVAPVLAQPSLPIGRKGRGALGVSGAEAGVARERLEKEGRTMLALRFSGDPLVPDARWSCLKARFGDRLEAIDLDPSTARPWGGMAPHSVLTLHLDEDDPTGPTKRAEGRVIAFLVEQLRPPAGPPA